MVLFSEPILRILLGCTHSSDSVGLARFLDANIWSLTLFIVGIQFEICHRACIFASNAKGLQCHICLMCCRYQEAEADVTVALRKRPLDPVLLYLRYVSVCYCIWSFATACSLVLEILTFLPHTCYCWSQMFHGKNDLIPVPLSFFGHCVFYWCLLHIATHILCQHTFLPLSFPASSGMALYELDRFDLCVIVLKDAVRQNPPQDVLADWWVWSCVCAYCL